MTDRRRHRLLACLSALALVLPQAWGEDRPADPTATTRQSQLFSLGKRDAECVTFAEGKQLLSARLRWDPREEQYVFEGVFADKSMRTFTGRRMGNRLVLETVADDDSIHQVTLTLLNEKRTLLLYQIRTPKGTQFNRVAEVGYTRAGTRLAEEGVTGRECIVTGGLGTIRVEHKGNSYWVCCTGCRDAFLDDPEGILAEAAARAKKRP